MININHTAVYFMPQPLVQSSVPESLLLFIYVQRPTSWCNLHHQMKTYNWLWLKKQSCSPVFFWGLTTHEYRHTLSWIQTLKPQILFLFSLYMHFTTSESSSRSLCWTRYDTVNWILVPLNWELTLWTFSQWHNTPEGPPSRISVIYCIVSFWRM